MTKLLRRIHGKGRTEPARLIIAAKGPGPRNVLLQFSDGTRVVKTGQAWRYAREVQSDIR